MPKRLTIVGPPPAYETESVPLRVAVEPPAGGVNTTFRVQVPPFAATVVQLCVTVYPVVAVTPVTVIGLMVGLVIVTACEGDDVFIDWPPKGSEVGFADRSCTPA